MGTFSGITATIASFALALTIESASYTQQNPGRPASPGISGFDSSDQSVLYDPGEVVLHWTATGDDDYVGQAVAYDIRYNFSNSGPINSEARWNQAIQLAGEPVPSPAGRRDSMVISGLDYGRYFYFSIRVCDDAGNWSALSNSPLLLSGDTTSAFIPGDVNNSGVVNGLDLVYLVNYFKGGPAIPVPALRADANGNCFIEGIDAVYLHNFLLGGPEPHAGDCLRLAADPRSRPTMPAKSQ